MTESVKTVRKRNGNIELLRLLSMLMVVSLHALWKGENLQNPTVDGTATVILAWLLESASIVAVNVFVLISGYFLSESKFKLEKAIGLILQTIFYSFGVFAICFLIGFPFARNIDTYKMLQYIFPLHMGVYWFVTTYVIVYLISPLVNRALKFLTEKQHFIIIVFLMIYESFIKSVLPVRLENDEKGYNLLWFLTVYLLGAYVRKYGLGLLKNVKTSIICYVIGTLLIFLEVLALSYANSHLGRLTEISNISLEYNHLFNIFASLGLFGIFINLKPMKESVSKIVCQVSPMALGVYLLHESPVIRYEWQKWVGVFKISQLGMGLFVLRFLLGICLVFIVGICVELLRQNLFLLISKALNKSKLVAGIQNINKVINDINEQ